ncbi:MAG TPA: 23S rRNA (adenine(2503)-C(2))-methyltransferase RlmN [Polyangiaceae bacterium]|nr:23S rRNA (adenine(2503)-C(2))-methyltransferase RlmN [Polyangiaceae bacterium]
MTARLPIFSAATGAAATDPAPRRVGQDQPSAYAALPAELAALGFRNPEHAFGQLQRAWAWRAGAPLLGRDDRALAAALSLTLPRLVSQSSAEDGSTKLLFELSGPERGRASHATEQGRSSHAADRVEAVHMPRAGRVTLCISSQVGCAMGCTFCATASMGFGRHLLAHEIIGQVLVAMHELGPRHPGDLTLVFMGMGEPLHNLSQVARAIGVLCHPAGLGLSARRITVSTSGLVPEMAELRALEPRPLLAISVNATTDEQRAALMPIGKRYPLSELRAALERFPLRPRERITVEYVLLAGVNDSLEDARRLAQFCAGFPHQINLIPFNEHRLSEFRAPSEAVVDAFARAILAERRTVLTVRRSRGRDVGAACGQLVLDA